MFASHYVAQMTYSSFDRRELVHWTLAWRVPISRWICVPHSPNQSIPVWKTGNGTVSHDDDDDDFREKDVDYPSQTKSITESHTNRIKDTRKNPSARQHSEAADNASMVWTTLRT